MVLNNTFCDKKEDHFDGGGGLKYDISLNFELGAVQYF
jgi:hypothetical protein